MKTKMWQVLRGRKLALILLWAILIVCIIGIIVPQKSVLREGAYQEWKERYPTIARAFEMFGLTTLFHSPLFYGVFGFLILNVGICTFNRISKMLKTKIHIIEIGNIVFHSSFVLILLAGLISRLTFFEGYIELVEGQSVTDEEGSYLNTREGPLFLKKENQSSVVTLERFDGFVQYYERGKDSTSYLILTDGRDKRREKVFPGSPIFFNGASIFQTRYYGPACQFTYENAKGEANSGYINFPIPSGRGAISQNEFHIPETPLRVVANLSMDTSLPVVRLKIWEGGIYMGKSILHPEEEVKVGEGSIRFNQTGKWSGLLVTRDSGRIFVFFSFILFMAGLGLMLFSRFYQKRKNRTQSQIGYRAGRLTHRLFCKAALWIYAGFLAWRLYEC